MEGPKSEQSTPAEFDESSTEASLRRIAETAIAALDVFQERRGKGAA